MPCSARPYTSNTEPPTTIPAVGQVTPRQTPTDSRAELGGGARAAGRSVPRGGKGNFPSLRGWGKLPLPTCEPGGGGAAGTPALQGDCLAGGLPAGGLVRGCGRPYARQRARRTLPARSLAWPGLPPGSPREARSREVAKKSPHPGSETHPPHVAHEVFGPWLAGVAGAETNRGDGAFARVAARGKAPLPVFAGGLGR
jgi:hypothetical protein